MTNPFSADFFLRHPVAHFMFYWCLLFTVFRIGDAFGSSSGPYPGWVHVLATLFGSCIVTTVGVFIQRRRESDKPTQGVVANMIAIICSGAVGFIDWLDRGVCMTQVVNKS